MCHHHGVDPLSHGFLDMIRPGAGDMGLWLESGIHQDPCATCLDKQGAAADVVSSAHWRDGQAA